MPVCLSVFSSHQTARHPINRPTLSWSKVQRVLVVTTLVASKISPFGTTQQAERHTYCLVHLIKEKPLVLTGTDCLTHGAANHLWATKTGGTRKPHLVIHLTSRTNRGTYQPLFNSELFPLTLLGRK